MPNSHPFVKRVNELLENLDTEPSAKNGVELANEILKLVGMLDVKSAEVVFESSLELPNAERYDRWFQPHPIFKSDRACFELAESELLQAKFYWLNKHSRQVIAGGVHFTPNFEDEEFTHNDRYKVGIDFFLSPDGKSLQVVLSNRGNLRVVELNKRLNSTQVDIFTKWDGAGSLNTQEALHTTLWESFKLKSVNQKFYDGVANSFNELLQHLNSIDKDDEEAKLFASRLLGRLLFCWFLRKKGIIDESVGYFDAEGMESTVYYKTNLERLFFLTLNTPIDERDELQKEHQQQLIHLPAEDKQPSLFKTDQKTPYLNGGLFEPHDNDWFKDDELTLPKGYFVNLYSHFEEFNFTTDESSPEYEQIAIDPEMLGRVFESLLATQNEGTGQQARKAKGAFYTPREIVGYMCKESLRNYLHMINTDDERYKKAIDDLLDTSDREWAGAGTNSKRDSVPKEYRTQIIEALDSVTVIDPACGSGAFPMGMLQLCLRTYERLESRFDPYKTKLQIIQNNIFGVDIEPMAVEIARLRAWLSLIVDEDDERDVEPLPNLDFKFVCANSLVPLDKELGLFSDTGLHQRLKDIRTKYFNARKPHTKKALQNEYYKLIKSEQTALIADDTRTMQLKSFDPFKYSHPAEFFDADQMFGILDGFDIVVANPPYVSFGLRGVGKMTKEDKDVIKRLYPRSAEYKINLYSLFMDKAIQLSSPGGIQTLIVPDSFLVGRYFSKIRNLMLEKCKIIDILMLSSDVFDATVGFSVVYVMQKEADSSSNMLKVIRPADRSSVLTGKIKYFEYEQGYFQKIKHNRFRLFFDEVTKNLVSKIEEGSIELGTQYRGRTGVRSRIGQKNIIAKEQLLPTYKPGIISGSQVKKYIINYQEDWINIDPNLLNMGGWDINIIEYPKILIRQTGDSLIASIDLAKYYHLNNVHSLAPITDNALPLECVVAILNSKLMNYYYQTISMEKGRPMAQTDIETIESLPFKIPYDADLRNIIDLVGKIEAADNSKNGEDKTKISKDIDNLIYKIYDLTPEEVGVIEGSVK